WRRGTTPRRDCASCGGSGGSSRRALRSRRGLEIESVRELAEHVDETSDLSVRVRRRDLNPEADFAPRNEWIGREGDVDPVLEHEPADRIDVLAVTERDLDDREAGVVRCMGAEPVEAIQNRCRLLPEVRADRVSALLVHVQAG